MRNDVCTYRRDLHKIPELELKLPKTKAYILKALEGIEGEICEVLESGILVYFNNHKETTIAFRSDMDALPVKEECEVDFKSEHEGSMHACGHDGHMAMMLAFAHELNTYYKELPHNVLLIFQPGEEAPGGAELICKEGVLKKYNVKYIFGTHIWPMLEEGVIATRKGELMARSSEVKIDIIGKTSHAAKYKEGIDAVEIGARFLVDSYAMEQSIPSHVYRLLRFGILKGGSVCNVVSDNCHLEGTLRAFQDEYYWYMREQVESLAKKYEEKTGCTFKIDINTGYPAVLNDEALVERILNEFSDIEELEVPEMISEDFAHYLKEIPGVFFFLGSGTGIPLHNSHFNFNEDILIKGVENYIRLSKLEW